jgi:hypothetical protein
MRASLWPVGSDAVSNDWDFAKVEPEALCLGTETQRVIEAMSAIARMALVRRKLHLVAACGSCVAEDPFHDLGSDALTAVSGVRHDRFDEASRRAFIAEVRHHRGRADRRLTSAR